MPNDEKQFDGSTKPLEASARSQIAYRLDPESKTAIKEVLRELTKAISRQDALTIPSGATTFKASSDLMKLTGAAAVTIATITEGYAGQHLKLIFTDANVTITDDATTTRNSVNLSAAFTSTANDVMTLIYDGNKWFESSRSAN